MNRIHNRNNSDYELTLLQAFLIIVFLQIAFRLHNAPEDLFASLGKNDQKLYIVPSQNLVVVRMGKDTGGTALGPSGFDNELWGGVLSVVMN